MLGSGFNKNNINAKINAELNQWMSLDFNARMSYTTIDGLSGGADTNESSAANSIVANAVHFRSVDPLTSNTDDESNNTSSQKIRWNVCWLLIRKEIHSIRIIM